MAAIQQNTRCSDNEEDIKVSSFKNNGNIQKKEGERDLTVLNNEFSSVSLNILAMKVYCNIVCK